VSITFRQAEGGRTTTRTVTAIAAGVVTVNTDLTTPLVGDIIEIFNATGTGAVNNGFYTLTAVTVLGGGDQYALRPAPVTPGGAFTLGSIVRLNRATEKQTTTALTAVIALTGNYALIEAAGALFKTNDVRINDRLTVIGSAIAANNGGWYVQEIVSETLLIVRPPDGNAAAGMTSESPTTANITVRHGVHAPTFTDEAAVTLDYILANAVPQNGPTGGAPYFGSGVISDFLRKKFVGGGSAGAATNHRYLFELEGFGAWSWDQSGLAGDSAFDSANEIFIECRPGPAGVGGGSLGVPQWNKVGTWAGKLVVTLGASEGDRYSFEDGSVWVGIRVNMNVEGDFDTNAYGSYGDSCVGTNPGLRIHGGELKGSIGRGAVGVLTTAGALLESPVIYGTQALLVSGDGDQTNVLIGEAASAANVTVPSTIGGLLVSADAVSPAFNYSYNLGVEPLVFLDAREDYDLATLVTFSFTNRFAEKHYTFGPHFVSAVNGVPVPIEGLLVVITEINEDDLTEVVVFSGLTDANGAIAAGAGTVLRRQSATGTGVPVGTNYFHRITTSGEGYPENSETRTVESREFAIDYPVHRVYQTLAGVPPVVEVVTVPIEIVPRTPTVVVDAETGTVEVVDL
jgi:hypothetical protein